MVRRVARRLGCRVGSAHRKAFQPWLHGEGQGDLLHKAVTPRRDRSIDSIGRGPASLRSVGPKFGEPSWWEGGRWRLRMHFVSQTTLRLRCQRFRQDVGWALPTRRLESEGLPSTGSGQAGRDGMGRKALIDRRGKIG